MPFLYVSVNHGDLILTFPICIFHGCHKESPQAESLRIEPGFLSVLEARSIMKVSEYNAPPQALPEQLWVFHVLQTHCCIPQLSCLDVFSCKDPRMRATQKHL